MIQIVPQELELTTSGSFIVGPTENDAYRCGPIGSPRHVSYQVIITSKAEHLDDSGFIIDWMLLQTEISNKHSNMPTYLSCEKICASICCQVAQMLHGRCSQVRVNIGSGTMPTGMSSRWIAD